MTTLSSSNRSQLARKLEGTYPTNWGVPQAGNGTNVRMTSESLDFTIKTEQSKEIRSDRQVTDLVQTGASAQGGFQFELSYKEFDAELEGALQSSFAAYGTNGIGAAVATLTLASGSLTADVAPTGNSAFTNLSKGQWFSVVPPSGASATVKSYFAGRAFRVSATTAPTSTVITLDAATQINTTIAGTSMSGGKISSSMMVNDSVMKSYTLEVGHQDVGQFRVYNGMILSKFDLKIASGAIITGSAEYMGKDMVLQQSTVMETPVASQTFDIMNAVRGVFDILEGGASISATTYIKSADISIDNSLRAQEAVGNFGNVGVAAGQIKVSGKMEVYFADATMYNKFLNNTASSIHLPLLDAAGNGYVVTVPRIKYNASKLNTGGLDQDNMLSLDFTGLMDTLSTSPTYQKTVQVCRVGA